MKAMKSDSYEIDFEKELSRLNEEQRKAVETVEGPVMVIAGPGTGKTQILAARIGRILQKTDAGPENILCLTFTDAGAIAMRNRLLRFIGPAAHKVFISTFHGFCNKIIRDNSDYFKLGEADPVTDLESREIIMDMIAELPFDNPLKRTSGDLFFESGKLSKFFELCKKEKFDALQLKGAISEYLSSLPNREEYIYKRKTGIYQKGDVKLGHIEAEKERMEKTEAAAVLFETYRQVMFEKHRYDFQDMILFVLEAMEKNPDLLAGLQEQYQYILVDEYQDTSGSQNAILYKLVEGSIDDTPNLFVVGDDDQSIYRFQGANIANITDFLKRYADRLTRVVLQYNYRSTQRILDGCKAVIENNTERLVHVDSTLNKALQSGIESLANETEKPLILVFQNVFQELAYVGEEIKKRWDERGDLRDIAIIYRKHQQVELLVTYLREHHIPFQMKKESNVLDSTLIKDIEQHLRYLNDLILGKEDADASLFSILHSSFYHIPPSLIGRLALIVRNTQEIKTWREACLKVRELIQVTLFESDWSAGIETIHHIAKTFEKLTKDGKVTPPQLLLELMIKEAGWMKKVLVGEEKLILLEELNVFYDFLKEEGVRRPGMTLQDFLTTLSEMRINGIKLPLIRIFNEEKGVHLLSAHGSKGLEFETVYIIRATEKDWLEKSNNRDYKLPDTLLTGISGDETEEERRLFYVAMTRARRHLYITTHETDQKLKETTRLRFVDELMLSGEADEERRVSGTAEVAEVLSNKLMPTTSIALLYEESIMRQIVSSMRMSFSSLSSYLRCPRSFFFENVLRVPSAKNSAMAFGSAVHFALEKYFKGMLDDSQRRFPDPEEASGWFSWYLHRHRDSFLEREFLVKLEYGRDILPKYINHYQSQWNKIVAVERNFNSVLEGIAVTGKIDKLDYDGKKATVTDYKTGKHKNIEKKMLPPMPGAIETAGYEERYGGDYWRQAVFYKKLVESEGKGWKVSQVIFDYIEPDQKTGDFHKRIVEVTEVDTKIVMGQLKYAYGEIQKLNFDKGCEEKDCKWCNYVKGMETHDEVEGAELSQREELAEPISE